MGIGEAGEKLTFGRDWNSMSRGRKLTGANEMEWRGGAQENRQLAACSTQFMREVRSGTLLTHGHLKRGEREARAMNGSIGVTDNGGLLSLFDRRHSTKSNSKREGNNTLFLIAAQVLLRFS